MKQSQTLILTFQNKVQFLYRNERLRIPLIDLEYTVHAYQFLNNKFNFDLHLIQVYIHFLKVLA